MPSGPRRRMKEYRGPDGLLAHPGEPAPNLRRGLSVAARQWEDFSPLVKVVARLLYEGWRDEAGEHRRFIGVHHESWYDMRQDDRALFCAMAEEALAFFPRWAKMDEQGRRALMVDADPWSYEGRFP